MWKSRNSLGGKFCVFHNRKQGWKPLGHIASKQRTLLAGNVHSQENLSPDRHKLNAASGARKPGLQKNGNSKVLRMQRKRGRHVK